ncbi:MAG: flavin reductase family protein, partial [Bacteroidales bacterium]|nr:flavin reductase family protein [Bacteroidales bacterium]
HADPKYLDKKTGALDLKRANLVAYSHGQYYGLGKILGKFGFSVEKKK